MHTSTQLKASMFDVVIDGDPAGPLELFPEWHIRDRLGVVIHDPFGGVGASHLIQLAITSYYDAHPRRRGSLSVYPEIYAFHVGGGHGSHADFDFWPSRREVILGDDPQQVLAAINDHAITRLAVPDLARHGVALHPKDYDAALDTIASAFSYSPTGRTADADLAITGRDRRTELNPSKVLRSADVVPEPQPTGRSVRPLKEADPEFAAWMAVRAQDLTDADIDVAVRRRSALRTDGPVTETYRRISVEEALERLAPAARPRPVVRVSCCVTSGSPRPA